MKEIKIMKNLLSIATALFVCSLIITPASADMVSAAGLIPAGYGYTHGRIPVVEATGRPEIHDAAIMRYDRNSRIRDIDDASVQNTNNNGQYSQQNQSYQRENF